MILNYLKVMMRNMRRSSYYSVINVLGFALGITCAFAQPEKVQKNVAIFIFNDVQIIDYAGPYEVFGNASENDFDRFKIFTVAQTRDTIKTIYGMDVIPNYGFGQHPKPDIIIIPGGWGVYAERKKPEVIQWIQSQAIEAQVVFSVCNGAFFLSKAGLLDGLSATTTAGSIDRLKQEVPSLTPVYDKRYVDNGKIITAGGLSSGIDASIYVVGKILGKAWSQKVANSLEYNWQPESDYSRGFLADRNSLSMWYLFPGMLNEPQKFEGDRDKWESVDILHTPLSSVHVMDTICNKLARNKRIGWSRTDNGSSSTKSEWTFKDHWGKDWTGHVSSVPVNGMLKQVLVTVRVNRK